MISGFRVLWRALVHFWDESLLMIKANVAWFVCSLPLFLLTIAVSWLFVAPGDAESGSVVWPMILSGFVMLVVPSPFAIGVYAVAAVIVNGESPEFSVFWTAVRRWWKRGLAMYAIGAFVLGGLIFNTSFYASVATGLLQAVSILWLYAIIFWITMQSYLVPLLVTAELPPPSAHAEDEGWPIDEEERRARRLAPRKPVAPVEPPPVPSLGALYKRAAILALANPLFSFIMLFGTLLATILSVVAMPVYPLLAISFVALVNCQGLRVLREKYFPTEASGVKR
ncbi:MAG: hypothetical protein IT305_14375 [Chloroflexi bacterium]|nr:hypothetical protein [Chloroflexota bacterium]